MKDQKSVCIHNDSLSVTLNTKTAGVLSVLDARARCQWKPGYSLFVLHLYDRECERPMKLALEPADMTFAKISSDEVHVHVMHRATGVGFDALFRVEDRSLVIRIPLESVRETNGHRFVLMEIEYAPCGFWARTGESGYLLLPNYSGIICRFNRTEPRRHRNLSYLDQSEWEDTCMMPVFGMVRGESAYLAIVESGDFDTAFVTSVHWEKEHRNAMHPCFIFRYDKADQIDQVDRVVRYHFLHGQEANYAGMARVYRNYLLRHKGILPLKDKIIHSPEAAYIYNAYSFIKIRCALREKQPDGSRQYHVYATFRDIGKAMQDFKNTGIEKMRIILRGWELDGPDGCYPTKFPIDQRLGGPDGLRELTALARKLNYQITFHDNYSDAFMTAPDWDEKIMIRDRRGGMYGGAEWVGGRSYFPCPYEATRRFLHRDLPKIKEFGLNGWYYLDGTPRALRGCYDASHGHPLTRRAEAEGMVDQYRSVRAYFGGCATEMPTAFALEEIDEAAWIPFTLKYWSPKELRYFCDEIVPFYHLAIHGIILYHITGWEGSAGCFGSEKMGILKMAEWGALPQNQIIGNDIARHLPHMKNEYEQICLKLGHLQLEFIESQRSVADGVSETTYSDGSRVIVNYSRRKFSSGKKIVQPSTFEILKPRG